MHLYSVKKHVVIILSLFHFFFFHSPLDKMSFIISGNLLVYIAIVKVRASEALGKPKWIEKIVIDVLRSSYLS